MKSCNSDGETYEYCQCTLDYLFENYTTKKVYEMSLDVIENEDNVDYIMPDELYSAVKECLYLIK